MQQDLYTLGRAQGFRQRTLPENLNTNANRFLSKHGLYYPVGIDQGQYVQPQMVLSWLRHERPLMFADHKVLVTRGAILIYSSVNVRSRRAEILHSYYLTYIWNPRFSMYDNVHWNEDSDDVIYKPGVVDRVEDFFGTLFKGTPSAPVVIVDVTARSNLMLTSTQPIGSHANMLVLNFVTHTAEYFEPHGHAPWTDSVVNFLRSKLPPSWSFDVPTDTCPGVQKADPGYCTAWCCLFLIYRLFYTEDTREQIINRLLRGGGDKLWERIGAFYGWARFWQEKDVAYSKWSKNTLKDTRPWNNTT